MKSETIFRVFFLKQHRKNSLKNIFVFLDFSFWPHGHRTTQNAHCAVVWSRKAKILLYGMCWWCMMIKSCHLRVNSPHLLEPVPLSHDHHDNQGNQDFSSTSLLYWLLWSMLPWGHWTMWGPMLVSLGHFLQGRRSFSWPKEVLWTSSWKISETLFWQKISFKTNNV